MRERWTERRERRNFPITTASVTTVPPLVTLADDRFFTMGGY